MKETAGFESAAALLPPDMRIAALALPEIVRRDAEELRLRAGRPPTASCGQSETPVCRREVTHRDLDTLLETATRASAHTALAGIASGFVTVRGGCRVGLCGEAVMRDGEVRSLRDLSSASVRIPREARGCADGLLSRLGADGLRDTLIISPPGAGKTTLLREMVRRLSDGGARVSLIDERGEVAGVWEGEPVFDVGRRTDVMTGAPKAAAATMLIRAMTPEFLAMDEITSPDDILAAEIAAGCGVSLIATAHAKGADELNVRPLYRRLLALGVFRRAIVVSRTELGRSYTVKELKAE